MFLFALLIIAGFGIYVMKPDERRRALGIIIARARTAGRAVRADLEACAPWLEAIRARAGKPFVALAIAIIYLLAPRTTGGEWWRVFTAMFQHRGVLSLAIDILAIVQLGVVVESIFGHIVFGTVFAASGLLANTIYLARHPVVMTTGAAGALYGLYGLLIVWAVQSLRAPSDLKIPREGYRLLAPVAGLFVLASIVSNAGALTGNIAALTFGVVAGFTLVGTIQENSPAPIRVALLAGSTAITIVMLGVPSVSTFDARPEIARVVGLEAQTAEPYAKAVGQFKRGTTSAKALADLIDHAILPEMRDAQARLGQLHAVPTEQHVLVQDAQHYLQLRRESWELRARALHSSNMRVLRLADDKERESLDAFEQLKAANLR